MTEQLKADLDTALLSVKNQCANLHEEAALDNQNHPEGNLNVRRYLLAVSSARRSRRGRSVNRVILEERYYRSKSWSPRERDEELSIDVLHDGEEILKYTETFDGAIGDLQEDDVKQVQILSDALRSHGVEVNRQHSINVESNGYWEDIKNRHLRLVALDLETPDLGDVEDIFSVKSRKFFRAPSARQNAFNINTLKTETSYGTTSTNWHHEESHYHVSSVHENSIHEGHESSATPSTVIERTDYRSGSPPLPTVPPSSRVIEILKRHQPVDMPKGYHNYYDPARHFEHQCTGFHGLLDRPLHYDYLGDRSFATYDNWFERSYHTCDHREAPAPPAPRPVTPPVERPVTPPTPQPPTPPPQHLLDEEVPLYEDQTQTLILSPEPEPEPEPHVDIYHPYEVADISEYLILEYTETLQETEFKIVSEYPEPITVDPNDFHELDYTRDIEKIPYVQEWPGYSKVDESEYDHLQYNEDVEKIPYVQEWPGYSQVDPTGYDILEYNGGIEKIDLPVLYDEVPIHVEPVVVPPVEVVPEVPEYPYYSVVHPDEYEILFYQPGIEKISYFPEPIYDDVHDEPIYDEVFDKPVRASRPPVERVPTPPPSPSPQDIYVGNDAVDQISQKLHVDVEATGGPNVRQIAKDYDEQYRKRQEEAQGKKTPAAHSPPKPVRVFQAVQPEPEPEPESVKSEPLKPVIFHEMMLNNGIIKKLHDQKKSEGKSASHPVTRAVSRPMSPEVEHVDAKYDAENIDNIRLEEEIAMKIDRFENHSSSRVVHKQTVNVTIRNTEDTFDQHSPNSQEIRDLSKRNWNATPSPTPRGDIYPPPLPPRRQSSAIPVATYIPAQSNVVAPSGTVKNLAKIFYDPKQAPLSPANVVIKTTKTVEHVNEVVNPVAVPSHNRAPIGLQEVIQNQHPVTVQTSKDIDAVYENGLHHPQNRQETVRVVRNFEDEFPISFK